MPLPLTVSCFSKVQIGFAFLVPAHPGSPGKRAVKRVCVCVCVKCWDTGKNGSVACCVVSSLHAVCKFMISLVVWWCWSAESLWIWQRRLLSSVSNVTHRTVLSVCLPDRSAPPCRQQILCWWLVSMLSYLSSARFSKSNPRTSGFGKLFTAIVPLFTKQQNW